MSTNPFGTSNSFGTPAAPPTETVEAAPPTTNRKPLVIAAAAGLAVLLAVGGLVVLPALQGDDVDPAGDVSAVAVGEAPVAADTPEAVTPEPVLPTLTQSAGRNPFYPVVVEGAEGATSATDPETAITGVGGTPSSDGSGGASGGVSVPGPAGADGAPGATGQQGPAGADGVTPEYATITYTGPSTTIPNAATFNVITVEGPTTVTVLPAGTPKADGTTETGVLDPTGLTSAAFLAYLGLDTDADSGMSYAKLQFGDSQVYRGFQDFPLSFFTPTTA